jgi:hypothetical protein
MPPAQHHQKMKMGRDPWGAIFNIDPHAACATPSEDENGPRSRGYFQYKRSPIIK